MSLVFNQNFHEQVHGALAAAANINDFYTILGGLLIDPGMFAYSRVCYFEYDKNINSFRKRFILGATTAEADAALRQEWAKRWHEFADKVKAAHESKPLSKLYRRIYEEFWDRLTKDEACQDIPDLSTITFNRSELSRNHLLRVISESPSVLTINLTKESVKGLASWMKEGIPVIGGRIITKNGLQGILVCSRRYEPYMDLFAEKSIFQWLINLASTTLHNIQLVQELKQTAERLKEIDHMKSTFLSIMSHELRTPMTSILGFIDVIASGNAGEINEMQSTLLKRVLAQANHMSSMVDDLLRLTVVETGKILHADIQPTNISGIVARIVESVSARATAENIVLNAPTPEELKALPRIMVDPNALERILQHLLDNAIKFRRPTGTHTIGIEITRENNLLSIGIRDNGIGMNEKDTKIIFNRFTQLDSDINRNFGGLGIGLSIVSLLLRSNNGEITVESQLNEGSLFRVSFPIYFQDL